MSLIFAKQLDPTSLSLFVQQAISGSAFSGNLIAYVTQSGWLGDTVVYASGSPQTILGLKTFAVSPLVQYSGSTGSAPSTQWVLDKDLTLSGVLTGQLATNLVVSGTSGVLNSKITYESGLAATGLSSLSGFTTNMSGALSAVRVTGSATIPIVNFTGLGGTLVIHSGNQVFISGGSAGSNTSVTGSAAISAPNFTGVGTVTATYDGTYVKISGAASAGGVPDTVTTTGTYVLAGGYTFSGSPLVPTPTVPSGATNILFVSGVSGVLAARDVTISGVLQTAINAASTVNNYTFSGITGNFVNMAYWFDSTTLATGLNAVEAMVGRSFFFTGYGIGVINTGTQGLFSGSLYQRTQTNTKTNFVDISLNSGVYFRATGGFNQEISGLNRVGLDIYLIGTGITGLSIGVFGVGY